MPYYQYSCDECHKTFEIFTTIAKRHEPELEEHEDYSECCRSSLKLTVVSPRIGYDNFALTGKKPDEGFRDKLRDIKKNYHGNQLGSLDL